MKLRALLVLGAAVGACVASACPQVAQPSATLARVKSSGTLACGVIQEDAEYSIEDDHGSRGSFDEDICKAFAIAAIGQKPVLKVVSFLDSASATAALRAGKVDVVASMSADFSHATTPGMRLSRPVLNDGIGFLVPQAAKIDHVRGLAGKKVCFLTETNVEVGLRSWFDEQHLDFVPFPFQEEGEMEAAYITKNCIGLAGDVTRLVNTRLNFGSLAKEHLLLPEVISRDPLASATRDDDPQWSNVISWVIEALIAAEEHGVTSSNVSAKVANPNSPVVEKLLGRTHDFGAALGLENDWVVHVLKTTGNYGEIYGRAFGGNSDRALPQDLNQIGSSGALMNSLPLK
jgi:general L-amino acid transport system substrate-binding protein